MIRSKKNFIKIAKNPADYKRDDYFIRKLFNYSGGYNKSKTDESRIKK